MMCFFCLSIANLKLIKFKMANFVTIDDVLFDEPFDKENNKNLLNL